MYYFKIVIDFGVTNTYSYYLKENGRNLIPTDCHRSESKRETCDCTDHCGLFGFRDFRKT